MGMSGSFRVLFDAINAAVEMVKTFVIKLLAAAVVENVPLAQGDDAFSVAQGVIHLMQRDDHGDAVVLIDVAQGVHHDAGGFRVQRGDGFIGQNHLRRRGWKRVDGQNAPCQRGSAPVTRVVSARG